MGREFLNIFEDWAHDYDRTVTGHDLQYKDVFKDYDRILYEVVRESYGTVLEFGVGTGNLSDKLLDAGLEVIGIEPSQAMRNIVHEKIPQLHVVDGDFLSFPQPSSTVNTIVSTYAFHHLTDQEKEIAVKQFAQLLPVDGKVVFADTMFESDEEKNKIISEAGSKGYTDLVEDLKREYYTTINVMKDIFEQNGFHISFKQMNDFVWVIIANKK